MNAILRIICWLRKHNNRKYQGASLSFRQLPSAWRVAKQLNISPFQLSYVTNSNEGEGLLFYGNTILPFIDHFPKDTELYRVMTTKPQEVASA